MGPTFLIAGGNGGFSWTPACGGLFTFDGSRLRSSHPMHMHAWYSIYAVTSGTATVRYRNEDWVAGEGMVVLLPPYEPHAEVFAGADGCSFRGVYPTDEGIRAILGVRRAVDDALLRVRCPVVDGSVLTARVLCVCDALDGRDTAQQRRSIIELFDDLRCRYSASTDREPLASGEHRAVTLVRQYLHASESETPSMRTLAEVAGLSKYHLSRVFRRATGLSPYAYFEQLRLARARLLLHTGVSVSSAAFTAGFSDQSHLTRHFAGQVAATPGAYVRAVRAAVAAGGVADSKPSQLQKRRGETPSLSSGPMDDK